MAIIPSYVNYSLTGRRRPPPAHCHTGGFSAHGNGFVPCPGEGHRCRGSCHPPPKGQCRNCPEVSHPIGHLCGEAAEFLKASLCQEELMFALKSEAGEALEELPWPVGDCPSARR